MLFFYGATLFALVLDQASKWWIRSTLTLGEALVIWPGWLDFRHVHNYGAAWGVFSGHRWPLVFFTVAVVVALVWASREMVRHGPLAAAGLGLILGGALGNLIDRVAQGYVTDFVDLGTPWTFLQTFPVFNVADSALTLGAIALIWSLLFGSGERRESPTSSEAAPSRVAPGD